MNNKSGFTIIELSIALVIIGIILSMIAVKSGKLVNDTKATSTIEFIKDLSGAISTFKNRYHDLPGDMPKASDDIVDIVSGSACDKGDGNGLIDDATNEIPCVASHLMLAGLIKGDAAGLMSPLNDDSTNPDVSVRSASTAQVNVAATNTFPASVQNVIELSNIPCDAAFVIDAKIDDGDTAKGKVRGEPTCPSTTTKTTLDIAL